ncbi:NHS-like protein 3 isoform X2 [Heptranchias perlo]|uniref:NHS-like protein 3 isoform X2 n=1 Tax=Heptranchias perlo TaxID=212740 RepID=UPI003559F401
MGNTHHKKKSQGTKTKPLWHFDIGRPDKQKKAASKLDDESKWSVHYKPSQFEHQQENIFLPSTRPSHIEDLHKEAEIGLKSLQEQGNLDGYSQLHLRNGHDCGDDCSQHSQDEDVPLIEKSGSCAPSDEVWAKTRSLPPPTPDEIRKNMLSTQSGVIPTGTTFKPQGHQKTQSSFKGPKLKAKRVRRTTIMGLPQHVQQELGLGKASHLSNTSVKVPGADSAGVVRASREDGNHCFNNISHSGARGSLRSVNVTDSSEGGHESISTLEINNKLHDQQNWGLIDFSKRPKSLAIPKSSIPSELLQSPVMSMSPQATYLSKIIPNAILPAAVDVVMINTSQHCLRTLSRSSLICAPSPACSRSISLQNYDGRDYASSDVWSNSQSSETIVSNNSTISSHGSPRIPLVNDSAEKDGEKSRDKHNLTNSAPDHHASTSRWVSACTAHNASAIAENTPSSPADHNANCKINELNSNGYVDQTLSPAQSTSSIVDASDTQSITSERSITRSLSVRKMKRPPAPPRRMHSLQQAEEQSSELQGCSPASPGNDDVFSPSLSETNSIRFQSRMDSRDASRGPAIPLVTDKLVTAEDGMGEMSKESILQSSNSFPQNPTSPNKSERTMSPSSGYSSQSGTPTMTRGLVYPSSPAGRSKPRAPERSSSLFSPEMSHSSSLASISSSISENVDPFVIPPPPSSPAPLPPTVKIAKLPTSPPYSWVPTVIPPPPPGPAPLPPTKKPSFLFKVPTVVSTRTVTPPATTPAPTVTPPATTPAPTVTPPATTPAPTVTPPATTPAPTVTPPATTPAPTVTPPATTPAPTVTPPATTPAPTVTPPATTPAPTVTPPATTPAPTVTPPATTPAPTVTPPATTPAPTVTPPATTPAPTVTPPATTPAPTVTPPATTPAPTVTPPATTPAPTVTPPATTPAPTVTPPATTPAPTVTPPATTPAPTVTPPATTPAPTVTPPATTPAPTVTPPATTPAPTVTPPATTPAPTVSTAPPKQMQQELIPLQMKLPSPPPSPPPSHHPPPPPKKTTVIEKISPPSSSTVLEPLKQEQSTLDWPLPPPPLSPSTFTPPSPGEMSSSTSVAVNSSEKANVSHSVHQEDAEFLFPPPPPSLLADTVQEKRSSLEEPQQKLQMVSPPAPPPLPSDSSVKNTIPGQSVAVALSSPSLPPSQPTETKTSSVPKSLLSSVPSPATSTSKHLQQKPQVVSGPSPAVMADSQFPKIMTQTPKASNQDSTKESLIQSSPNQDGGQASIPIVTPSLLQMVRLRSVQMSTYAPGMPDHKQQVNNNQLDLKLPTKGNVTAPNKPARKSLSLRLSSSSDSEPSIKSNNSLYVKPTTTTTDVQGQITFKPPDDGAPHKSPASTASFIFSKNVTPKRLVFETPRSPEAEAEAKKNFMAELSSVSGRIASKTESKSSANPQSKAASEAPPAQKKPSRIPPPVAKKPPFLPSAQRLPSTATVVKEIPQAQEKSDALKASSDTKDEKGKLETGNGQLALCKGD